VPVTFANSSTVSVRAPDGRWYEIRIVADDGNRAWPSTLFFGRVVVLTVPLYAIYRLMLRALYALRRSTKKRVEVVPWATEDLPPPDRARPLLREAFADEATARVRASDLRSAISKGESPW
jgi:hypothetical protein